MKVQTVLGPVKKTEIGLTYVHEHLITRPPIWRIKLDPDYFLDSVVKAVEELKIFKAAGGNTLVDATTIDYGRDINALLKIAHQVKVNIIAITGFNRGDYYDEWSESVYSQGLKELVSLLIKDVTEGIENTDSKAGVIKVGTSYNKILPQEEKAIKAVARAHLETNAPVETHTDLGTMALEQLDILENEGVDLGKVAIGHMDRNLDFWYHTRIVERGAFIRYDGPSKIKYYSESARIKILNKLVEAGFEDQILISADMGRRSYLKSYGGGPGFEYLIKKFIPRLTAQGWDEKLINKIFIDNPGNFLAF